MAVKYHSIFIHMTEKELGAGKRLKKYVYIQYIYIIYIYKIYIFLKKGSASVLAMQSGKESINNLLCRKHK